MPHTADTMGLIHRPGVGPNNRYDFKNKGNNRANEKAPPGREKQVKALKGKVDNPYAVAWASYNKSKKNEDAAGVGIITKQNTTADVKPGEVQRQAKKLGMTIDKKGRPPLAHKTAAKNTSPNKAYNLGLTNEAIRKEGNKYTVYSKKGDRKFGTYTSKAEAEKRLRQVEMFKHIG